MIAAISSVTDKTVLNKNLKSTSFKRNDDVFKNDLDDLSLIPDYRDIVVNRNYEESRLMKFVESVNRDVEVSQAQLKIDMLREKFDSIKDDEMKKNILSWMIADAIDEMETVKLHYNEL